MITILCGKSGSGKNILLSHLVETGPYQPLISEKTDDYSVKKKEFITISDMKGAQDYISCYGRENCFVVMLELLGDETVKFSNDATENIVNFCLQSDTESDTNIEDMEYLLSNALVAYERYIDSKAVKQEPITEQLICYEDYTFYPYDEEPVVTVKVMPKSAYKAMSAYADESLDKYEFTRM